MPALVALYRLSTKPLGRIDGQAVRADFLAAIAALLGVLVFDTLPGLFFGIAVSLLLLLYRASRPNVAELGSMSGDERVFLDRARHAESVPPAGVAVLRPETGLFFANAEAARSAIRAHADRPDVHAVVVDAETVPYMDVTAARVLDDLAEELAPDGVTPPWPMASVKSAT